jgi:hypothetical protein
LLRAVSRPSTGCCTARWLWAGEWQQHAVLLSAVALHVH